MGARPLRVEPEDHYLCAGCGQTLTFDAQVRVPDEQLAACQSRCDWTLVARRGRPVEVEDSAGL